ncbi:hypothetical protein SB781_27765 [Paraburkholderia sp. SIMBA_061]
MQATKPQKRPYIRARERPRDNLDKSIQTHRAQRSNSLLDKAKELKLPECGRAGFVEHLPAYLRRVERPVSTELVQAYVELQRAAHQLKRAIDSVRTHDVHYRSLAGQIDRVEKELRSLLLVGKRYPVDKEATYSVDGTLIRFSFDSKRGRPTDYTTELACEAALAWHQWFRKWPSSRGEGRFHKMLKLACQNLLKMEASELPGRNAVQAGISLCKHRLANGWSGGRVYSAPDDAGMLQIRAKGF